MIYPSKRTDCSKPTIEDLLQLKRAERPSPEFWARFEQDLRTKQLAAIVEKRPWWISMRLPQLARQMSRFQVPVGAAAVLALTFVVVRDYHSFDSIDFSPVAPGVAQNAPMARDEVVTEQAVHTDSASAAQAGAKSESSSIAVVAGNNERYENPSKSAVVASSSAELTSSESLMSMIPWAASRADGAVVVAEKESPIGELSQVYFASAVAPGRDHDFDGTVKLESLVVSPQQSPALDRATAASDAVASVTPREVRRNRILTNLAVGDVASADAEPSRLGRIREVLVSSLDDDRLYDSVRRVGMGGDRFTVKF